MSDSVRVEPEDLWPDEWVEWFHLTPAERWRESEKLWAIFLSLGGNLDPEPDTQSPFYDPQDRCRALLMGGQACVLYGAAEFSRDADFAIVADDGNLVALQNALDELQAKENAVPPFEADYLERGHAVHFRCFHPQAEGMRV